MRTFVIGDVHGCVRELGALVQKLKPTDTDTFVFVGDLLDKGPDSVGVLRYVQDLRRHFAVVLVEGNHEEKHRRYRGHLAAGRGSVAEKMGNADGMRQVLSQLCDTDLALLDSSVLWHGIGGTPDKPDHVVVHGGIMPGWAELPPLNPYRLPGKARKEALKALRLRHVTSDGSFVVLGEEGPQDAFWAEQYDGRFGFCYFGHEPFLQKAPKEFPHAVGLDLGCVFGGRLCAAVLRGNELVDFETVEALETYAERKEARRAETALADT